MALAAYVKVPNCKSWYVWLMETGHLRSLRRGFALFSGNLTEFSPQIVTACRWIPQTWKPWRQDSHCQWTSSFPAISDATSKAGFFLVFFLTRAIWMFSCWSSSHTQVGQRRKSKEDEHMPPSDPELSWRQLLLFATINILYHSLIFFIFIYCILFFSQPRTLRAGTLS